MNNINAVFQSLRCPNCDTSFHRTLNLERHLTTCSQRVKYVFPRNVYQIRETLFDKLDSFGINSTSEQKLFKNSAILDFTSVCVQEETFRDTNTTTWIGKHVPILVSISSNNVEKPTFLCNSDHHQLVASFIGALQNLAPQSKAKLKNWFLDIETTIKVKLGSILEKLSQRHNRRENARFDMSRNDCDNEICASTQLFQIQKKINLLVFKKLWNVIAIVCMCLVSTVQKPISTYSNPFCYPFSLTNGTFNPLSSRERTSSSRSNLVIFS